MDGMRDVADGTFFLCSTATFLRDDEVSQIRVSGSRARYGLLRIPTTRGERLFCRLLGDWPSSMLLDRLSWRRDIVDAAFAGGLEVSRVGIASMISLVYCRGGVPTGCDERVVRTRARPRRTPKIDKRHVGMEEPMKHFAGQRLGSGLFCSPSPSRRPSPTMRRSRSARRVPAFDHVEDDQMQGNCSGSKSGGTLKGMEINYRRDMTTHSMNPRCRQGLSRDHGGSRSARRSFRKASSREDPGRRCSPASKNVLWTAGSTDQDSSASTRRKTRPFNLTDYMPARQGTVTDPMSRFDDSSASRSRRTDGKLSSFQTSSSQPILVPLRLLFTPSRHQGEVQGAKLRRLRTRRAGDELVGL